MERRNRSPPIPDSLRSRTGTGIGRVSVALGTNTEEELHGNGVAQVGGIGATRRAQGKGVGGGDRCRREARLVGSQVELNDGK